jgi:hypothetical protein
MGPMLGADLEATLFCFGCGSASHDDVPFGGWELGDWWVGWATGGWGEMVGEMVGDRRVGWGVPGT